MDLREYLNQGDVWISAGQNGERGTALKIGDMSIEHRRRAARWLTEKAPVMIAVVEAQVNEGLVAGEGDIRDLLSLIAQHPKYWIRNTRLFTALVSGIPTKVVIDV